MTKQELTALFIKMLNNQCSEDEADLIVELLADEDNAEIFDELIEIQLSGNINEDAIDSSTREHLDKSLELILKKKHTNSKSSPTFKNKRHFILLGLAATVLVFLSAGIWLYYHHIPAAFPTLTKKIQAVLPGGNRAILTLADGTDINLNKTSVGEVAKQANRVVRKVGDGELLYQRHDKNPLHADTVLYNVLTTPKGGQYQVVLPDGTKVWLNAASSIRYPTIFSGQERRVELSGEAYFEVAKMQTKYESNQYGVYTKRLPFIVVCDQQEIEVLGTRFNVNSYADEPGVKTSLIQGTIRIHWSGEQSGDQHEKFDRVLEAGEQAVLKKGKLRVENSNVDLAIDWKNGKFQFENEPVESIMRKIARWYNVDIEYRGNMETQFFSGTLSRYDDVNDVLKMLELTGTIHFKIKDRTIIVIG